MADHNSSVVDENALQSLKEAVFDWLSQELKTEVSGKFAKPYDEFMDYYWAQREENGIMGYSLGQYCVAVISVLEKIDCGISYKLFRTSADKFTKRRFGQSFSVDDSLHQKTFNIFCFFVRQNICYVTDGSDCRLISTTTNMATILPWLNKKYKASDSPQYYLTCQHNFRAQIVSVEELQPRTTYTWCKRPPQEEDKSKQKVE